MPTGQYNHSCRRIDMTDQTIGYAHVDSLNKREYGKDTLWNCTCLMCGSKFIRSRHRLLAHKSDANCGCLWSKKSKEANKYKHMKNYIYGDNIRKIYDGMKKRCYSKYNKSYKRYGEVGIEICEEWLNDKWQFYEWSIQNGYVPGMTIDRIDNDKGYSPDNCRWATMKEQQNNKKNNRIVVYNGKEYTVSELADFLNIDYNVLYRRVNSKNSRIPIDAPVKKYNRR